MNQSKRDILKKTIGVEELKRSCGADDENKNKLRSSSVNNKVWNHLKKKYGTFSAGINILALKDMGEL